MDRTKNKEDILKATLPNHSKHIPEWVEDDAKELKEKNKIIKIDKSSL